ncbi:MAG: bi-domain-containing oxidoreductase [Candidatus Thorarchaeota archaeon]
MKQVVFQSGQPLIIDLPPPQLKKGMILVDVHASCISTGTEIVGLDSSGKSLIQKAKENPEKLKSAFIRMKSEGVFSVLKKAQNKLADERLAGYSAAGVVRSLGDDVSGFSPGMRVAIAGAGYANHAELAAVPVNLAMHIPDQVTFEEASTCALGGIALQGIRRAETSIGDYVVVFGCGALGLLTIQMLRAAGVNVIGIDLRDDRLDLAREFGSLLTLSAQDDDVVRKVIHATDGHGADRVILTVATDSPDPIRQAFEMSRRKGRVVLVGVAGMQLDRKSMYRKELDFVISTSYGPGRYDREYEENGTDYPYAYVRWTEQRNMIAYLNMILSGAVKLNSIIGKSYPVEKAEVAYQSLKEEDRPLLVLLTYSPKEDVEEAEQAKSGAWTGLETRALNTGIVGVGAFVQGMHIPNLNSLKDQYLVKSVCDRDGITARKAARLLVEEDILIDTDYNSFLNSDIQAVIIGTRHNTHASFAIKAMNAGKAVFVEKPMCISREEFEQIKDVLNKTNAPFMVGYNRRFAPPIQKIREITDKRINPIMIQYTMNGGYVPYDTWVHTEEGGGRIIGEACHIFDLFRSITDSEAISVSIDGIQPNTDSVHSSDNVFVTVKYSDGSVCSLLYTGLGNKKAPKEQMKVFCDEQLLVLTDYKQLVSYGVDCNWESKKPEKGHLEELQFFYNQIIEGNRFPIPLDQLEETWLISRQVADQLTD